MRIQLNSSASQWLVGIILATFVLAGCTVSRELGSDSETLDPALMEQDQNRTGWVMPKSRHIEGTRQWPSPAAVWGDLGGWVLLPEVQWSRTHWSVVVDPYGQPHHGEERDETVAWIPGSSPPPRTVDETAAFGCVVCHQEQANGGRYPLYKLGSTPQSAAVLSMLEMHDDRHRTQLTLDLRFPKDQSVQIKQPVRCASCHETLGQLLHRSHRMGEGMGGCASCHGGADAAQGTNNQQGCRFCHEPGWEEGGGATVRTQTCAQCHPDPFTGLHRKGHGGLECLDCHGGVHGGHGQANPAMADAAGKENPHCGGCHQVDSGDRPVPRANLYEDRWMSLVRAHWIGREETKPKE